jgi:hypothetical protein
MVGCGDTSQFRIIESFFELIMDEELEQLYRTRWDVLSKAIPHGLKMSNPLLAAVPPDYECSKTRLLIIGKETHGWGLWDDESHVDRVAWLRDCYRDFGRGRDVRGRKHNSPFFQAASELQRLVNPDSDLFAFTWLNLFICDQNKELPKEPIAEELRKVSFLRDEVSILKPHAVVFFTGPNYDYTIKHKQYFPDTKFLDHPPLWSEVRATGLPSKTVRTKHPKNLRLRKQFGVLDEIAAWIKQAQ